MPAPRLPNHRLPMCRIGLRTGFSGLLCGAALLLGGCAIGNVLPDAAMPGSPSQALAQTPPQFGDRAAALELVDAMEARLALMQDVAVVKWTSGAPIADAVREAAVLDTVARRASELGLGVASVRALFDLQIRLAREAQQRWHDEWHRQGTCTPCRSPRPLADIRNSIDAANEREIRTLYVALPGQLRSGDADAFAARLEQLRRRQGLTSQNGASLLQAVRAVSRDTARTAPVLDRIRAAGLLRIGTPGDYAPFSLEGADGSLSGADVDLALDLARELGVTPVFVRTSWPTLTHDLVAARFDVALGGISYTEERAQVGAYSRAYHEGGKTFVARCDEAAQYDTLAEVDRPGVRVVVNPGGTNERYVREHLHAATIVVHPDNRTVFDEIVARRADVMVTDDVEADLQALRYPGRLCRPATATLTRGEKRILMLPDPGLQQVVDAWLARAIADGLAAGTLRRAMERYARPQRH